MGAFFKLEFSWKFGKYTGGAPLGGYGGGGFRISEILKKSIIYGWGCECGGYTVGVVGPYGGAVRWGRTVGAYES